VSAGDTASEMGRRLAYNHGFHLPAHPEAKQLLDRAVQNPHDAAPWLVYADWLDEHDYPVTAAHVREAVPRRQRLSMRTRVRRAVRLARGGDDERAFQAAIAHDPEDAAPVLVYADWLDEHGAGPEATALRAHADELGRQQQYDEQERQEVAAAHPFGVTHTRLTARRAGGYDARLAERLFGSHPEARLVHMSREAPTRTGFSILGGPPFEYGLIFYRKAAGGTWGRSAQRIAVRSRRADHSARPTLAAPLPALPRPPADPALRLARPDTPVETRARTDPRPAAREAMALALHAHHGLPTLAGLLARPGEPGPSPDDLKTLGSTTVRGGPDLPLKVSLLAHLGGRYRLTVHGPEGFLGHRWVTRPEARQVWEEFRPHVRSAAWQTTTGDMNRLAAEVDHQNLLKLLGAEDATPGVRAVLPAGAAGAAGIPARPKAVTVRDLPAPDPLETRGHPLAARPGTLPAGVPAAGTTDPGVGVTPQDEVPTNPQVVKPFKPFRTWMGMADRVRRAVRMARPYKTPLMAHVRANPGITADELWSKNSHVPGAEHKAELRRLVDAGWVKEFREDAGATKFRTRYYPHDHPHDHPHGHPGPVGLVPSRLDQIVAHKKAGLANVEIARRLGVSRQRVYLALLSAEARGLLAGATRPVRNMRDATAFGDMIAASPGDHAPALVFADYLEENGYPAAAEAVRRGNGRPTEHEGDIDYHGHHFPTRGLASGTLGPADSPLEARPHVHLYAYGGSARYKGGPARPHYNVYVDAPRTRAYRKATAGVIGTSDHDLVRRILQELGPPRTEAERQDRAGVESQVAEGLARQAAEAQRGAQARMARPVGRERIRFLLGRGRRESGVSRRPVRCAMSDIEPLRASVRANPLDQAPRLVLADALDELGDDRSAREADDHRMLAKLAGAVGQGERIYSAAIDHRLRGTEHGLTDAQRSCLLHDLHRYVPLDDHGEPVPDGAFGGRDAGRELLHFPDGSLIHRWLGGETEVYNDATDYIDALRANAGMVAGELHYPDADLIRHVYASRPHVADGILRELNGDQPDE
jgi:uncharacterized protein (TIGR02996 family)